jgi:hypothetical protein
VTLDTLSNVSTTNKTTGDFLKWSGTAWIPSQATSTVGSASSFYLDATTALADNLTLQTSPSVAAEVINTKTVTSGTSPVFVERFVSGTLGRTTIPAGTWTFNNYIAQSAANNDNFLIWRVNKRVEQTGMTGTFTGAGATRTFTVTGGTPFVAGDANASITLASLIETPTQTAWISGFTSSSIVTVTLTDPAFVNVSGVTLNAIYYLLFRKTGLDITWTTTPTLQTTTTVQPAFSGLNLTDRLVVAYFDSSTHVAGHTMSLYYEGSANYTNFVCPLTTQHNDLSGLNDGDYKHLTATEYAKIAYLDTTTAVTGLATKAYTDYASATLKNKTFQGVSIDTTYTNAVSAVTVDSVTSGTSNRLRVANTSNGKGKTLSLVKDTCSFQFVLDGGGSVLTTGTKMDFKIPYNMTLTSVDLLGDQSGTIRVNFWKDALANYPPTAADSVCNGNAPMLSAQTNSTNTLTSWSATSWSGGQTIRVNIDVVATITRVTVVINALKN